MAILIGLAVFAVMGLLASVYNTFPGDVWVTRRVQSLDWQPFADLLNRAEDLAAMPTIGFVTLAVVVAFLVMRKPTPALLMLCTLPARSLVPPLKDAIDRPRPSADLVHVLPQPSSASFPSGHSFSVMLVYGLLFYLIGVYVRPAAVRIGLQVACAGIIVLAGLERVYVGHHWPSDVLGGFLAGALFIALFASVLHARTAPWRSRTAAEAGGPA